MDLYKNVIFIASVVLHSKQVSIEILCVCVYIYIIYTVEDKIKFQIL